MRDKLSVLLSNFDQAHTEALADLEAVDAVADDTPPVCEMADRAVDLAEGVRDLLGLLGIRT